LQELLIQAEGFNQFEKRLVGKKTLRAEFELKAVFFFCGDEAAGACAGLEDARRDSRLLEVIGAGQAGNSSANHDCG
jgi:hypothetical protein